MIRDLLFPSKPSDMPSSALLLAARLMFGLIFISHGFQKLTAFLADPSFAFNFPDPVGVGNQASFVLAVFGEFICGIGFVTGFLYRLALIPMMFTMCIAFFVIHRQDPFLQKEIALVYLFIFILMFIAGPGKFAVDRLFVKKTKKHQG